MKTIEEIEQVLLNLPQEGTKFSAMTYERGIEEALAWVIEEISDEEFEYAKK
jgi:uncharacterized phage-like protein YoqJ